MSFFSFLFPGDLDKLGAAVDGAYGQHPRNQRDHRRMLQPWPLVGLLKSLGQQVDLDLVGFRVDSVEALLVLQISTAALFGLAHLEADVIIAAVCLLRLTDGQVGSEELTVVGSRLAFEDGLNAESLARPFTYRLVTVLGLRGGSPAQYKSCKQPAQTTGR